MMEKDPLFVLSWHGRWCKGMLLLLKKNPLQGKWQVVHCYTFRFTDLRTQSLGVQMLLYSLSYHVLQEMLFFWEIVRLDSPYSAWQSYSVLPQRFLPQILSSSAPATITADLAAEEGNTAVPRHHKYYPATVRGTRQLLSGCSQLRPGQVCHQLTLCYSSGPTESCLVMKTRNCLCAFFHKTNHPLLAPTLSCEAASVLSWRCCLEGAVPMSSSMFPVRDIL